jgi:hypothetical protein
MLAGPPSSRTAPSVIDRSLMSQSSCISDHPLFLTAMEWDVGAMDPAVRS